MTRHNYDTALTMLLIVYSRAVNNMTGSCCCHNLLTTTIAIATTISTDACTTYVAATNLPAVRSIISISIL